MNSEENSKEKISWLSVVSFGMGVLSIFLVVVILFLAMNHSVEAFFNDNETENVNDFSVGTDTKETVCSPEDNLFLYFPFDGNVLDASGNNRDAATENTAIVQDRFGNSEGAYDISETNNIIFESYDLANLGKEVTISFWMKTIQDGPVGNSIAKITSPWIPDYGHQVYHLRWDGGSSGDIGKFSFSLHEGYGGLVSYSSKNIADGNWHKITGVRNKDISFSIYIDGQKRGLMQVPSWRSLGDFFYLNKLIIGGHPAEIDDFRIYTKQLSNEEIYNQFLSDQEASPLLCVEEEIQENNGNLAPPFYVKVLYPGGVSLNDLSEDENISNMTPAFVLSIVAQREKEDIKKFQEEYLCVYWEKFSQDSDLREEICTEHNVDEGYGEFGRLTQSAILDYSNSVFYAGGAILRVIEDEKGDWKKQKDGVNWYHIQDVMAEDSKGWVNVASVIENFNQQVQDEWEKQHIKFISPIMSTMPETAKVSSIFDHTGDYLCGFGFNNFICDKKITSFLEGEVGEKIYGSDSSEGAPAYAKETGLFFEGSRYINYIGANISGCVDNEDNSITCLNKKSYLNYDGHPGIDYSYGEGTKIVAPADGVLCLATENTDKEKGLWRNPGKCKYGDDDVNTGDSNGYEKHKTFYIIHGDSGLTTWYLHSSEIINSNLAFGINGDGYMNVKQGQTVAKIGKTCAGCLVPYHLHFDVRSDDGANYANLIDPYGNFFGSVEEQYESLWKKLPFINTTNIFLGSPGELRVYDFEGNMTGLKNGEVIEEIPFSEYGDEKVLIQGADIARIEVVGLDEDVYQLDIVRINNKKRFNFSANDIMTSQGEIHSFVVDWDGLDGEDGAVEIGIDKDGDGVAEQMIEIGSEFSDTTAPQTQILLSEAVESNSWHNLDAQIILTAEDNEGGVGVQKTEYSLDGGVDWMQYAEPFVISEEGIHEVQYRSTDWFGSEEEIKTVEIKIDKTAPEMEIVPKEDEVGFDILGIDNLSETIVAQDGDKKYIIADEAGNALIVEFEKIQKYYNLAILKIKSLQYNEGEVWNTSKNKIRYIWKEDALKRKWFGWLKTHGNDKEKTLSLLHQRIELFKHFRIDASYNKKKDETKVFIHEKGKPQREVFDGLQLLEFKTNNGQLEYNY